ncbi:hypothetical protein [Anabaena sp. UHCC 0399]|uniref:hypothetical protein n=1 Tax=Anabaena sp. UHCC 0399 TaxID=3110238 RepID=UPI002B219FB4|nr:hypothetical protein [Anabaena sp. UHCC 0399]MEA5565216.1 hypothetical protein [Anabaena sp. UHCC 0399]
MSKISNSELGTLLLSEISYSALSTQHSALSTHYSELYLQLSRHLLLSHDRL